MQENPINPPSAIHPGKLLQRRKLEHAVENRSRFAAQGSELNLYETHQTAEQVFLQFDQPVLASMIEGKKVMHLGPESFDFMPGESLVVPPGEPMLIDFPLADTEHPTRCLALAIEPEFIQRTMTYFNEQALGTDGQEEWEVGEQNFHLLHDPAVVSLLNHLIDLYSESHRTKDLFIELSLKELIVRLAQSQARSVLMEQAEARQTEHRLAQVVHYIQQHPEASLSVAQLSQMACLSQSHFFRMFHNHFGITPQQYVLQERMKRAEVLLQQPGYRTSDVADRCGYSDVSYFGKVFKKWHGVTPVQWKQNLSRLF